MIVSIQPENVDNLTFNTAELSSSHMHRTIQTAIPLTLFKSDQSPHIYEKSKEEPQYKFL